MSIYARTACCLLFPHPWKRVSVVSDGHYQYLRIKKNLSFKATRQHIASESTLDSIYRNIKDILNMLKYPVISLMMWVYDPYAACPCFLQSRVPSSFLH